MTYISDKILALCLPSLLYIIFHVLYLPTLSHSLSVRVMYLYVDLCVDTPSVRAQRLTFDVFSYCSFSWDKAHFHWSLLLQLGWLASKLPDLTNSTQKC